jgi:hypothetical protein
MNPLNQNPKNHTCAWCAMLAVEFYNDEWLCEDHLDEEMEDEDL